MRLLNIIQLNYHIDKASALLLVDCLHPDYQRDLLTCCKQVKSRLNLDAAPDNEFMVLHNFITILQEHLLGSCHVVLD